MIKDFKIPCKKCGFDGNQEDIHLHHIIPKAIGGTDRDGRIYLCKKCHDILHNMLPGFLWRFVGDFDKVACKDYITKLSKWWVNK